MKKIAVLFVLAIFLASCNVDVKQESKAIPVSKATIVQTKDINDSEGYKLMEQKCFTCHFASPDPTKRDQMIAPPMLRVQEHYKPTYPNKEDFVKAVQEWVANPTEDKVLMPGAVRKFKLMPKMAFPEKDIKLIAEAIFDTDFGEGPKMHQGHQELRLNEGKKWKLEAQDLQVVANVKSQLSTFTGKALNDYNQLGKDVFDDAKSLLMNENYDKSTFNQIHSFFSNVEGNMHTLIGTKSMDEAQNQVKILKKKFNTFNDYFE